MERSVTVKRRLPGQMLSVLYSPKVLSAHLAARLSETPDCKAVLLPQGFLSDELLFCLGRAKNGFKSTHTPIFCDPVPYHLYSGLKPSPSWMCVHGGEAQPQHLAQCQPHCMDGWFRVETDKSDSYCALKKTFMCLDILKLDMFGQQITADGLQDASSSLELCPY